MQTDIGEEKISYKKRAIAIIPARGGSKRIPRKNIKPFMGKPVIAYSIEAALQSGMFDEVMVSTEDEEIADIAKTYGAKIPFMRSIETAGDYVFPADVVAEVLDMYKKQGQYFDTFCCIFPTAPFIKAEKIVEAYSMLSEDIDSVFPMVPFSYHLQRGLKEVNGKIRMIYPQYQNARSQDLETYYHDVGQFYLVTTEAFSRYHFFWGEHTSGLILSELETQDIDTEIDWKLAEIKYKLLNNQY